MMPDATQRKPIVGIVIATLVALAITIANAISVAITMPTISLRCVASIEVFVVITI